MLNGESSFYLCWINVQFPDIQLANLSVKLPWKTESDCDVYRETLRLYPKKKWYCKSTKPPTLAIFELGHHLV